MGRSELIGNGKRHLVPRYQPAGTGDAPEGRRSRRGGRALTQHTGLPPRPTTSRPGPPGRKRKPKA
jgi:hypothetical protein